jgi:hypothetical protein
MTRLVQGSDGREWQLRGQMEWRPPATADDFEHDTAAGWGPMVAMLSVMFVLVLVLVGWKPDDVVVPSWLVLGIVLVFVYFPMRWVWRRPWTMVAETHGEVTEEGAPAERWVGTVRGLVAVRAEFARTSKSIERHALPDFDGPLRPME